LAGRRLFLARFATGLEQGAAQVLHRATEAVTRALFGEGVSTMLYLDDDDEHLGRDKARELLRKKPKVVRHTKAWVDDSQLCLVVECLLKDGATITVKMSYCWDDPKFHGHLYFYDIVEWVLNGDWKSFYRFVQKRFTEVLRAHATNPAYWW
jgi:hypothetical protein